jgi:hypothetical protein
LHGVDAQFRAPLPLPPVGELCSRCNSRKRLRLLVCPTSTHTAFARPWPFSAAKSASRRSSTRLGPKTWVLTMGLFVPDGRERAPLLASQEKNEWPREDLTNPFAQPERTGIVRVHQKSQDQPGAKVDPSHRTTAPDRRAQAIFFRRRHQPSRLATAQHRRSGNASRKIAARPVRTSRSTSQPSVVSATRWEGALGASLKAAPHIAAPLLPRALAP